jgi:signal transduction histidine kinase
MTFQEPEPGTGAEPGVTGGSGSDDKRTIALLRAQVAFLEKKLQLVGSVTRHDVLNQMTAIVGYNELLGMMTTDPKFKNFLEKERFALTRIRHQFQYAKDYQNIAVDPPRWQSIRNITSRISEDFDTKTVKILAGTGSSAVLADPLLERAFYYLFWFAIPPGGTTTEVTVSLHADGLLGILVIRGNGTGVPAAEKEKIFERGYGRDSSWGLFIAREILATTGMTIRETGDPAKGVQFEITIPAGSFRMDDGEKPAG